MILRWHTADSYLRLTKGYNFDLEGMDGITRRRPTLTINGTWGGSRYGRGKGIDITSRLADIMGDRWIDPVWNLHDIDGLTTIEGDKTEHSITSTLTLWRVDNVLGFELTTTDSVYLEDRDSAHFLLMTQKQEVLVRPESCIVIVTQRQFQQFVNLALAMQDFSR